MNPTKKTFRIDKLNSRSVEFTGSAFFIAPDGTFLSARHNFLLSNLSSYGAFIDGEHYPIQRIPNPISFHSATDLIALRVVARSIDRFEHVAVVKINPAKYLGRSGQVNGYDSLTGRFVAVNVEIQAFDNGIFTLQHDGITHGLSGGPLLVSGVAIAVVSHLSGRVAKAFSFSQYDGIFKSLPVLVDGFLGAGRLLNLNQDLRAIYLNVGNPTKAYELAKSLVDTSIAELESFPLIICETKINLSYMLVNGDKNINSLFLAERYLNESIAILNSMDPGESVLRLIIRSCWLLAIIKRLLGDLNGAYRICETTKSISWFPMMPLEMRLPIEREIAIVAKNSAGFRDLLASYSEYSHNQIESFFTLRRIFEHYVGRSDLKTAGAVLRVVDESFALVRKHVFKIYEASFWKNRFHYYHLNHEPELARQAYVKTSSLIDGYELHGQRRSLENLAADLGCAVRRDKP